MVSGRWKHEGCFFCKEFCGTAHTFRTGKVKGKNTNPSPQLAVYECGEGLKPAKQSQACLALNASAYIRICFTIASRPLLRVGDKCSFKPIRSMK